MNAASVAKTPTIQKRTVVRGRLPNANYRSREYLTEREVERLMKAAGGCLMIECSGFHSSHRGFKDCQRPGLTGSV